MAISRAALRAEKRKMKRVEEGEHEGKVRGKAICERWRTESGGGKHKNETWRN